MDNWISVKDRLPKDHEIVLTALKKDKDGYCHIQANPYFKEFWDTVKVTHWMPLPEPPK